MLSLATGYDVGYLTDAVGGGREGYYTKAVAAGEPPGVWYGAGVEVLGLSGEVDAEQMRAVYAELRDPRDVDGEALLGKPHKNYRGAEARARGRAGAPRAAARAGRAHGAAAGGVPGCDVLRPEERVGDGGGVSAQGRQCARRG